MPWIKDKVTGERKWFPSGGVSRETVRKMIDDAGGVSNDEVKTAVEEALTQAKESGDFKGDKGDPGYTPQKGVDYFDGAKGDPGDDYILTEADKTEIAETAADIVDDALSEVIGDPSGTVPAVPGYMALGMTGAAVGMVARVKSVDADGKPTEWEAVEDVSDKVKKLSEEIADLPQADWNQNDETAKDYVKNRPFWTDDPVETVLIAETTNEWTALGFDGALILAPIEITEGTTYKVNWDGTLYECVSYMAQAGIVAVGNDVVGGAGDTGGKGEPFFITVFNGATMVIADSVGSHTFEVVECVAEVHKIDEKYLSDKLMRLTDAEVTFQPCKILDLDSLSRMLFGTGRFLSIENGETHPVPVDVWGKLMDMVSEPQMFPICVMRQPNESYFPVISEVYDDGFEIMSQIISVSNGIFTCKRYIWILKYDADEQTVSISLRTIDL